MSSGMFGETALASSLRRYLPFGNVIQPSIIITPLSIPSTLSALPKPYSGEDPGQDDYGDHDPDRNLGTFAEAPSAAVSATRVILVTRMPRSRRVASRCQGCVEGVPIACHYVVCSKGEDGCRIVDGDLTLLIVPPQVPIAILCIWTSDTCAVQCMRHSHRVRIERLKAVPPARRSTVRVVYRIVVGTHDIDGCSDWGYQRLSWKCISRATYRSRDSFRAHSLVELKQSPSDT